MPKVLGKDDIRRKIKAGEIPDDQKIERYRPGPKKPDSQESQKGQTKAVVDVSSALKIMTATHRTDSKKALKLLEDLVKSQQKKEEWEFLIGKEYEGRRKITAVAKG